MGDIAAGGLPAFLEESLKRHFDADDVARIVAGSSCRRFVTLRANTLKASAAEVAAALDDAGVAYEGVSWYGDAFVLPGARERDIWALPIYEQGGVYLQSLSSMIPALVLGARSGEDILDMCAAPGGKTSQIVALSQGSAHVTACEMHPPRADKLEHNLQKLGAANVTVLRTDARRLDDFFRFDRILVDAPCTGSGTLLAGDAKAHRRFTPELLKKSAKSQRALLVRALTLLKPGGTLVYSTCSVLPEENEGALADALAKVKRSGTYELADCATPLRERAQGTLPELPCALDGALCLCPTDSYEGFFVAKIVRTA